YRLLEDSCLRDRRFGPKARRTSPSNDPGRVHVGMDLPFTPETAEALAVPVPGVDVAARAALLAGIGGVHDRGRNAVPLFEILQLLPHYRPPTVLQQPVHAAGKPRRPGVQALEDQVGGTVPFDALGEDPVDLGTDITTKLLDVSPIPLRGARPPSHALQVGGTGGDPPIQLREVCHEIPPEEVTPVRREERPQPEVQRDPLRGGLIGLTLPLIGAGHVLRQPEDQGPVLPLGDLDRVPEGALPLKGIAVRQKRHLDPLSPRGRHETQPEREGPGRPRLLDLYAPDVDPHADPLERRLLCRAIIWRMILR